MPNPIPNSLFDEQGHNRSTEVCPKKNRDKFARLGKTQGSSDGAGFFVEQFVQTHPYT